MCPSRFSVILLSLSRLVSELDSTVADSVRSPALAEADPAVGDALGDIGVAWFLRVLTLLQYNADTRSQNKGFNVGTVIAGNVYLIGKYILTFLCTKLWSRYHHWQKTNLSLSSC